MSAVRIFAPRPCVRCEVLFVPTGPRSQYCATESCIEARGDVAPMRMRGKNQRRLRSTMGDGSTHTAGLEPQRCSCGTALEIRCPKGCEA